ncbi:MAG: amidohydrolase family protein [Reyranellaceae bacterium]
MPLLDDLPLVDHHCHGIVRGALDRSRFEALISESHRPPAPGTSHFDKPLGLLVRRDCAPLLDLEPLAPADRYIARRQEIGPEIVARRLLRATGIGRYLVDTGHRSDQVTSPAELADLAAAPCDEVVRIESVIEAAAPGDAAGFAARCEQALRTRAAGAVGLKSIVAYRASFAIDQTRPSPAEVAAAASTWLARLERGPARLENPVILRFGLWLGLDLCRERGLPLQLHVGFGDADVTMHACDPTHFTGFIRAAEAVEVPIALLHNYPFVREAGWLAEVFQNAYFDVGAILNYAGPSALAIMRHAMELGPFGKHLFSTDAFGLPELYYLGALQFRRTLGRVLDSWIAEGHCTAADAEHIALAIAGGNARRIYPLVG